MTWIAQAPSNIALIKYMGKRDFDRNLPTNASFSYTLPKLETTVRLQQNHANADSWQALDNQQQLSESGQKRFIQFLEKIKQRFDYKGCFDIASANNFPTGTGIASSASSFAALTQVACTALSELTGQKNLSQDEQAELSRSGSGSSIRSFYQPWGLWRDEHCHVVDLPYTDLIHQVIIIDAQPKKMSSTEAHRLVETSPLFHDRLQTIDLKLDHLLSALHQQDWKRSYAIVKEEFLQMHTLFHTCEQPFQYMRSESEQIIAEIDELWQGEKDGPLITMDAGPNIHLLYRLDQAALAEKIKTRYKKHFNVL